MVTSKPRHNTVLDDVQAHISASKPLPVEVGRYLRPGSEGISDPCFEAYHAYGEALISEQLLEPGATSADFNVILRSFQEAKQADPTGVRALLPAPEPAAAKVH